MLPDIQSPTDTETFVNGFYGRIRADELLGPVFSMRIPDEGWQPHLEKMYSFWNSILFNEQSYHGRPFPKHLQLPVSEEHFKRWVNLFHATVDENFAGENADDVKRRAENIALMFHAKIERFRGKDNLSIL